ncbi:MAG: 50S ribosomal protein L11 [Chloroflexi bacterium]|nr:50S ribosomal protein L11 [Chloroflexota bacterium]
MKKLKAIVKLQLEAGKASPAPPVGPALAPHGVNMMAFCKEYNAKTKDKAGMIIPVVVTIYTDGSYVMQLKTPPTSFLLKRAAKVEKGASNPPKEIVGRVTRQQVREIAEIKKPDMNTDDIEAIMRQIEGTARNMGIEIVD